MSETKLTDAEIMQILECCSVENCEECKRNWSYVSQWDCMRHIMRISLNLINREKAEVERLNKETKLTIDSIRKLAVELIESAKSEAIKDVLLTLEAEAVSSDKYIREYEDSKEQRAYNQALWKACSLVKEMEGE